MRKGKWFIYLFTAALVSVVTFFGTREYAWDGKVGLTAELTLQGQTETIHCWESEWGDYYLFLPGCAEPSQLRLRTNTRRTVTLDDQPVTDGAAMEGLQLEEQYDLCFGGSRRYHLTILRSGCLPVVCIDTASGSMEHIHQEKGNEEAGTIQVYTAEGTLDYTGNLESIKGRGNATWLRSKKPYSLQLFTAGDLLGMGQAENWILLANAYDITDMRNKLAFDLAQQADMAFTPALRWVDLYLNGQYAGLYMLCERNEVHPQRVDIARSGSFLVSMELGYRLEEQGYPYVTTESGTAFRIHYADMTAQRLQQILQSAENAILSEDGVDPVTGKPWTELIDADSWTKKYLLEEILANYDAGSVSQYFYYDGSDPAGKLYAGPVWDYDNILGNREWQTMDPKALLAGRPHISSEIDTPWFYALYQKDAFANQVKQQYRTVFRPLLAELMESGLDDYADTIETASQQNALRWSRNGMGEATAQMKQYLAERTAFLDSLWLDEADYCMVQVTTGIGAPGYFAVRPGGCLALLPEYEETLYSGWQRTDTGETFVITEPIYEDMTLGLKSLETPES